MRPIQVLLASENARGFGDEFLAGKTKMRKQEYIARAIDCLCVFFHRNLLNCHYITNKSSLI